MSQQNQNPYGGFQQPQQQQSGQAMTPEQMAAYQAYLASSQPTASWPAGYSGSAPGYSAAPQGVPPPQTTTYVQHHLPAQGAPPPPQASPYIYVGYPPTPLPAPLPPLPTPDKPYSCNQCTRAFKRQDDLRRHAQTHVGGTPHACPYPGCTNAYTRKDALQRHQHRLNHHV